MVAAVMSASAVVLAEQPAKVPSSAAGAGVVAPSGSAVSDNPFSALREKSVLFNGWGISPVGEHVKVGAIPLKIVISPDGKRMISTSAGAEPGLSVVDPVTRKQTQWIPLPRVFNGLVFSLDGKHVFATGGNSSSVHCFAYENGALTLLQSVVINPPEAGAEAERPGSRKAYETFLTAVSVHPTTGDLYICSLGSDELWVVEPARLLASKGDDAATMIKAKIRVGSKPYSAIFGADGRHLYVSNWAERTVSVVDTKAGKQVRAINVGIRPNDMALSKDGRLFVACAGENTVHVLQTRALMAAKRDTDQSAPPDESALEIISTSLYPQSPEGSTPCGVAVSPGGERLYVVNADNNDAMVADITDPKLARVLGFVPSGWYPTAVAAYGEELVIGNGKGLASRENFPPRLQQPNRPNKLNGYDLEYRIFEGYLSFVAPANAAAMQAYTNQVKANSPFTPETIKRPKNAPSDSPIPSEVGEKSPIKHVIYVIKENRTYDQVFGAFKDKSGKPMGNGDPKLTLFGEEITPNQHAIVRDYVLLDNFYCNGEVSVDGHAWCGAAIATDANQKGWITSYTGHGKMPLSKDLSAPVAGYIWDLCKRHGVSFKCYGEGASQVASENRGNWSKGRDPEKVEAFLKDLEAAEKSGVLPQFMIMSLGENHTQGTAPGKPTPAACVASNDVAVGKLVEAMSKSRFWKETAIFIVEDDAQNGPDHVDSHRTCAMVVSPWARRGVLDSTMYSQASMLRTIELILGLPPLTQYDAGATPMYGCFQNTLQADAYTALPSNVDLAAINKADAPGASLSAAMDFDEFDEAPEDELNRILWAAMKGPGVPYPIPVRRAILMH